MTFWDLVHAQLNRCTFRIFIGLVSVAAALGAIVMLSFHEAPESNRDTLLIAIGTIIGWGGAVVASQFGDRTQSRRRVE
jgi:hypothetical protein